MEDGMKNRVALVLGLLSLIFLFLWLGAKTELSRQKKISNVKSAQNMELEEKYLKLEKERAGLEQELKDQKARLSEQAEELETVKKTLSQELLAEGALKAELERVTVLKEGLEKELKEARAGAKS